MRTGVYVVSCPGTVSIRSLRPWERHGRTPGRGEHAAHRARSVLKAGSRTERAQISDPSTSEQIAGTVAGYRPRASSATGQITSDHWAGTSVAICLGGRAPDAFSAHLPWVCAWLEAKVRPSDQPANGAIFEPRPVMTAPRDANEVQGGLTEQEKRENLLRLAFQGRHDLLGEFCQAIEEVVPPGTTVVLRGSAVTGKRWKDAAPFDAEGRAPATSTLRWSGMERWCSSRQPATLCLACTPVR